MQKLLVITVLVALLALSAESFRVPREAVEEQGTLSQISGKIKSFYQNAIDTANGYVENIHGLKLEEKAKTLYKETAIVVSTYGGIVKDQIYHMFT